MLILGISAYFHDSAACVIKDGKILVALQEERFSRKKHDERFPVLAIKKCLETAKIDANAIDYVVFFEKPLLKFERILETYLAVAPKGFKNFKASFPVWINEKLFLKSKIIKELSQSLSNEIEWAKKLKFSNHHLSHAASAFFASPFDEAIVVTVDGVGEWNTLTVSLGKDNDLTVVKELNFPHSLGLLYSAVTAYCGFKVNSGEYKLMGLAPYGDARYSGDIEDHIIEIAEDGSFRLNMTYFGYLEKVAMFNDKFERLFGKKGRDENEPIEQFHMDMAASIQAVIEKVMLSLCGSLAQNYNIKNLCLAGGVALNCVSNGKIAKAKIFNDVWVQPASGDAGGALGAALAYYHMGLGYPRNFRKNNLDLMEGSYLGNSYNSDEIKDYLEKTGAVFEKFPDDELFRQAASAIADGKAVGWMRGRMEFGPRALGNRSILANPADQNMQTNLNLKIKFRESFRPFAPSVLKEKQTEWFDGNIDNPYMLFVSNVNDKHHIISNLNNKEHTTLEKIKNIRSKVPAITHVDYSARVQTVSSELNPDYHRLITEFCKLTSIPMLVNTSFNVRGEPIVESPKDAYKCFMGTGLDILIIGAFLMKKEEQPKSLLNEYKDEFELD